MRGFIRHEICQPDEWTWTGRPRVLVEGPDAWAWRPRLAAAGYEVVACRGPSPYEQCPLLVHGECATASAADEIVCDLPASERGAVVDALTERYPLSRLHRSPRELLH
jgi:hypothetical protein